MKRKFTATLCLLFFSALTACGGQDIPAETAPTIRPAVFSQDAQDLLDVLGGDDTLAFFDYTVEEPIHSVSTEVWKYVDGSGATISTQLGDPREIVCGEEIPLWMKTSSDSSAVGGVTLGDFHSIDCATGLAVAVTFSDAPTD